MVRSPPQLIHDLRILPFRMRMVIPLLEQITVMKQSFSVAHGTVTVDEGWSIT